MGTLAEDNAKARAMGLSYGEYKALTYSPGQVMPKKPPKPPRPPKKSKKSYSDRAAFALWQQGKSDAQIGAELGVSRTIIQRWRDDLELPSNQKNSINTKKYRLGETKGGIFAIIVEN